MLRPFIYYDCLYDLAEAYCAWAGLPVGGITQYRVYCALVGEG